MSHTVTIKLIYDKPIKVSHGEIDPSKIDTIQFGDNLVVRNIKFKKENEK